MTQDFMSVTETAGDDVTQEQINRIYSRYNWAKSYCHGKDVVEVACGTGQGLGIISDISNHLDAGDFSYEMLSVAKKHYQNRICLTQFDAQFLPYKSQSKDVVIIFEAIYYISDVELFVQECIRLLRPGGIVLVATANKDLFDFNPSPYSYKSYGVNELREIFSQYGFSTEFFGGTPVDSVSVRQKILRPLKKLIVSLNLMPKSMAGKKLLKRIVFGNLVPMPAELDKAIDDFVKPTPIASDSPDNRHKVIFCIATLEQIG